MKKFFNLLTLLVVANQAGNLYGQKKFTRENYFDYLAPLAPIIRQTAASANLHLYGDPQDQAFRDQNPADGIDDGRAARLHKLAAKFSPVLRRNNYSVPRDFTAMLRLKYHPEQNKVTFDNRPTLYVDTWDLSKPESQLVQPDFIDLSLAAPPPAATNGTAAHHQPFAGCHEKKLQSLLEEFGPDHRQLSPILPEQHLEKVLYFNFPGHDEASWRKIYRLLEQEEKFEQSRLDSKIYAHFFIQEESNNAYEFVIQYWFFYPFNDGGNNHEGDWEHINVRITSLERRGDPLTVKDIAAILDQNNTAILETLLIKKVDYYFHHFVMTLDYQVAGLDFYQPDKKQFLSALKKVQQRKLRQDWLSERIYDRLHLLKDSLNTHPIGYIGADNIGLDQLLMPPGESNRNSHGTYPFPGIWKRVGPVGATERANGGWHKYKFLLPSLAAADSALNARSNPWYEGKSNDWFLSYAEKDIFLIPDWETLKDSVRTNAAIRRQWFWLLLPIRWGFPVVGSLGGGLIKHADLGNSAPVGPAFNKAWNRAGATAGYQAYEPHILPLTFTSGVQDNFLNSWGYFNLTRAALSLPTINIPRQFGLLFFESKPKYLPREELSFRFVSPVYRAFMTIGDHDLARLLPELNPSILGPELASFANAHIDMASLAYKRNYAWRGFMYNLHLGRTSGENSFSISDGTVRYDILDETQRTPIGRMRGTLRLYELIGSLRQSFSWRLFQPFARVGYGWNWYRVENLTLNGRPLPSAKTPIFHKPSFPFLPNTWHAGLGMELFFKRNADVFKLPFLGAYAGKPELGIRLDYTLHGHRLGKKTPDALGTASILRQEIGLGLVLGL